MPHLYSRLPFLCSRQSDFRWTGSRAWSPSSGYIKDQRLVSGKGWTKDVAKDFSKGNWSKAEEEGPGRYQKSFCPVLALRGSRGAGGGRCCPENSECPWARLTPQALGGELNSLCVCLSIDVRQFVHL